MNDVLGRKEVERTLEEGRVFDMANLSMVLRELHGRNSRLLESCPYHEARFEAKSLIP